jgi:molybdopterin converting factor small subunit
LSDQATTVDVVEAVRRKLKASTAGIPMQVAVNQQYVRDPVTLQDGDEVALITPVQGG